MTGSWRAGLADPFDAKVHPVLAVGQPDDLVELELGLDTAQLGPLLANVDRNRFLGEDMATAVGAEDAYFRIDHFARLAAPAHPVVTPIVPGTSSQPEFLLAPSSLTLYSPYSG